LGFRREICEGSWCKGEAEPEGFSEYLHGMDRWKYKRVKID
jgi:hypothetical protein